MVIMATGPTMATTLATGTTVIITTTNTTIMGTTTTRSTISTPCVPGNTATTTGRTATSATGRGPLGTAWRSCPRHSTTRTLWIRTRHDRCRGRGWIASTTQSITISGLSTQSY